MGKDKFNFELSEHELFVGQIGEARKLLNIPSWTSSGINLEASGKLKSCKCATSPSL